jgi:hypothetical protein
MRVTRVETGGDGRRSVFFAFGQETLDADDGAKVGRCRLNPG